MLLLHASAVRLKLKASNESAGKGECFWLQRRQYRHITQSQSMLHVFASVSACIFPIDISCVACFSFAISFGQCAMRVSFVASSPCIFKAVAKFLYIPYLFVFRFIDGGFRDKNEMKKFVRMCARWRHVTKYAMCNAACDRKPAAAKYLYVSISNT